MEEAEVDVEEWGSVMSVNIPQEDVVEVLMLVAEESGELGYGKG